MRLKYLTAEHVAQLLKVNPGGIVVAPTGISITPSLVSTCSPLRESLTCCLYRGLLMMFMHALHCAGAALFMRLVLKGIPFAAQMSIFPILHVLNAPAGLRTTRVGHIVSDP